MSNPMVNKPRLWPCMHLFVCCRAPHLFPYFSRMLCIPVARCQMLGRLKPPDIRRLPGGVRCWVGLGAPTSGTTVFMHDRVLAQYLLCAHKTSLLCTPETSCVHISDLLCAHQKPLVLCAHRKPLACTQEISCVHPRDLL